MLVRPNESIVRHKQEDRQVRIRLFACGASKAHPPPAAIGVSHTVSIARVKSVGSRADASGGCKVDHD